MTTDELRAKFEAWCLHRGINTEKRSNGHYLSDEVCFWWKLWSDAHASRDAEVEALRTDAERYRWLRDRVTGSDGKPFICIFHGSFGLWSDEYADQAIDAAMREESK